jgi:hypothetical protein
VSFLFNEWEQLNGNMATLTSTFPTFGPLFNVNQMARIRHALLASQSWWDLVSRVSVNVMPMHHEFIDVMPKMTKAAQILEAQGVAERKRLAETAQRAEEQTLAKKHLVAEESRLAEEKLLGEEQLLAKQSKLAKDKPSAEQSRLAKEKLLVESSRLDQERLLVEQSKCLADKSRLAKEKLLSERSRLDKETLLAEQSRLAGDKLLAEQAAKHILSKLANNKPLHREEKNTLPEHGEPDVIGSKTLLKRFNHVQDLYPLADSNPRDDNTWGDFDPFNDHAHSPRSLLEMDTEQLEIDVEKRRELMEDGFSIARRSEWEEHGMLQSMPSTQVHLGLVTLNTRSNDDSPVSTPTSSPSPQFPSLPGLPQPINWSPTPTHSTCCPQVAHISQDINQDDTDSEIDELEDSSYEDDQQEEKKKKKRRTRQRCNEKKGKDKAQLGDDLGNPSPLPQSSPSLFTLPYTQASSTTLTQAINYGLLSEASTLMNPETISFSGLSSEEGAKIVASFLSLDTTERAAILELSIGELGKKFKQIVRSGPGKRDHSLSPKIRRIRHKHDS